jgi:hypothetical protein
MESGSNGAAELAKCAFQIGISAEWLRYQRRTIYL